MIFLDSDALINLIRALPEMKLILNKYPNERFCIASPVLYEIYYGFYYPPLSKRFNQNKIFLNRLKMEKNRLELLLGNFLMYDMDFNSIKKAAQISATLDSQGEHIEPFDILISAIVLNSGNSQIITNNNTHYQKIQGIEVINF